MATDAEFKKLLDTMPPATPFVPLCVTHKIPEKEAKELSLTLEQMGQRAGVDLSFVKPNEPANAEELIARAIAPSLPNSGAKLIGISTSDTTSVTSLLNETLPNTAIAKLGIDTKIVDLDDALDDYLAEQARNIAGTSIVDPEDYLFYL